MEPGDDTTWLPGEPPLAVHWRRSPRARRMSLRVSGLDGRITLTLPPRATRRHGMAFLDERADWLRQAVGRLPETCAVVPGARLPVEGEMLLLVPGAVRAPRVEGDVLLVPDGSMVGRRALAWLKLRARQRIDERTAHFSGLLERAPRSIRLRDTRSRWGSCSAAGDLMFSWRLIMAPPLVLDYVVAHEVAHLVQMNHAPAFWAEVARLMPGYAAPRAWLQANGSGLHRYRFSLS